MKILVSRYLPKPVRSASISHPAQLTLKIGSTRLNWINRSTRLRRFRPVRVQYVI
ncbi:hypothetical protein LINPERHAP1_LOCUS5767 [Linum perenne]